jgi:histidine kinase/DNA gyrase B/HSP90-like ATPase
MESMSRAPYLVPSSRFGARMGDTQMIDSIVHDGLIDALEHQSRTTAPTSTRPGTGAPAGCSSSPSSSPRAPPRTAPRQRRSHLGSQRRPQAAPLVDPRELAQLAGRTAAELALLHAELALGPRRLDPELETTIYRFVQEALTNVAKHARAEHVRVRLTAGDDTIEIEIADDGRGFDPGQRGEGFGLVGMQERAALYGGDMQVQSTSAGTTIRASIPIAA